MSSTTNSSTKSDYLKPLNNSSSTNQFDSTQSPLALLAQTCSSIGKDFSSSSSSLIQKSSSIHSNSTSLKRPSPSDNSSMNPTKKSTHTMKTNLLSTPSSFIDSYPLTNSFSLSSSTSSTTTAATAAAAALLLQSSLAYLSTQQHPYSSSCSISGCYQCETSTQLSRYRCSYFSCTARFSTNEQLIEHIRLDHSSLLNKSPLISSYRYHPYFKPPTQMFNSNDQLPYFYPYLSLTPMTETTRQTKKNSNNPN